MRKDILLKILNEKSMQFTREEINEMLDAELEKSPEEMDTDFVDLCLDALESEYPDIDINENKNLIPETPPQSITEESCEEEVLEKNVKDTKSKGRKIKFIKSIAIIAAAVTVLAFTITVGAKIVDIDASNDLVDFNGKNFIISLFNKDGASDKVNVVNELTDNGIENVVLPNEILSDEYIKYNFTYEDIYSNFEFKNEQNGIEGSLSINRINADSNSYTAQSQVNESYYKVEQIENSGIDILVFESNKNTMISYVEDNMEYTITLTNCDFETAKKIAESIKGV